MNAAQDSKYSHIAFIIGFALVVGAISAFLIWGLYTSYKEKDYAENVIKKSYMEHGCYLDDNLPPRFNDFYLKDGYVCPVPTDLT